MKRVPMALVVLVSGAAAGEPSHECAGSNPDVPLMTAVEMACEDDEIQFGFRCEAEEVKPLALLSSGAIACEADEIQFGFRP